MKDKEGPFMLIKWLGTKIPIVPIYITSKYES